MAAEIVHDDDVAWLEDRNELLFDVGAEALAVAGDIAARSTRAISVSRGRPTSLKWLGPFLEPPFSRQRAERAERDDAERLSAHRRNCRKIEFHLPEFLRQARHGAPVRINQNTAPSTRR